MNKSCQEFNILVIGLGSMGKRRIRNLVANGVSQIKGFDPRDDRRNEVENTYHIQVFKSMQDALEIPGLKYDAWIISVPPDAHHLYMKKAVEYGIPAFIEASVVDTDMIQIIKDAKQKKILLAPSCTLYFHPAIKKIAWLIKSGSLGKISNLLYHSGQYLPDWHTYEKVSEYYVSKKETGGAREIVPFELTWLTMILGFPKRVTGFYKKTIEIEGAENIEDTYNILLDYKGFMVNLCVDVVSRNATRRLLINGDKKQLYWDWNENAIKLFDPAINEWENITYQVSEAHSGYNKNITESMYNQEVNTFLTAIEQGTEFPNTLERDHQVLKLLYDAEKSSDLNTIETVL
jgi:predicted dehydrogenase